MSAALIVFLILAVIAIAAAVAMLLSNNTIYSALYLIMNFIAIGVIYLTLGAPFIALAQITVYAGAIMVLFLFVIMMLGAEKFSEKEPKLFSNSSTLLPWLSIPDNKTAWTALDRRKRLCLAHPRRLTDAQ